MKKLLSFLFGLSVLFCQAEEKILARVGIITDTHVMPDIKSCIPLEKAFRVFKKAGVDMIVHCGDAASSHKEKAYQNYRATFNKVFPQKKPVELFAFAGHDRVGIESYEKAWPLFKKRMEIKHEPYSKTYLAGYIFLTAPQNTNWKIYEKQIADACRETPGKPVFLIDHVPALNTCYYSKTWGNASTRRVLDKYPQIVQLSGHVHGTFKNEQNIWQGNFTAVNAGCCGESYSGFLVGTAPERTRADEALIMEISKNKLVFRRYDLAAGPEGKEYKPDQPWVVPMPFDPAAAPYTAAKRKLIPPEEFPANAGLAVKPDRIPCDHLELVIPEIQSREGAFIYDIRISRKNAAGRWEPFVRQEIFGAYNQAPGKRKKFRSHKLSAGYFEPGKNYKIDVAPVNYFYTVGKAVSVEFKMPERIQYPVLFESKDPMKDCRFVADRKGDKEIPVKNGFYQHKAWFARLLFPDAAKLWAGPRKARFRLTIDMHTIQPEIKYRWFIALSNVAYPHYPFLRITTPPGDSGSHRIVVDFAKPRADHVYHLYVAQGDPGQIRFNYIKVEKLP